METFRPGTLFPPWRRRKESASPEGHNTEVEQSRAGRLLFKLRRRKPLRDALLRGHLISFTAVNAFLAFLNFVTASTHSHPWVLYVLGAWAIPMSLHAVIKRWRDTLQEKLEAWLCAGEHGSGELPEHVFRPLRRLHRTKASFSVGAGTAGLVSAYLLLVDVLTGGSLWAAIPIASMALVVLLRGLAIPGANRRLLSRLEEARMEEALPNPEDPSEGHPAVKDARDLRDRIAKLVSETVGEEGSLVGHVDEIVAEIERLTAKAEELSQQVQDLHSSYGELMEDLRS